MTDYDIRQAKKQRRQEIEGMVVGVAGPMLLASTVPGLGEVQFAGMLLDNIDAYGYNKVINREGLTTIFQKQLITIANMQNAMVEYLKTGHVSANQLKLLGGENNMKKLKEQKDFYDSLDDDNKKKTLNMISAWGVDAKPQSTLSNKELDDMKVCMSALDKEELNKICKIKSYKDGYNAFYDKHKEEFDKNAVDAIKNSMGDLEYPKNEVNSVEQKKLGLVIVLIIVCIIIVSYSFIKIF
jgi:hypothetical protein